MQQIVASDFCEQQVVTVAKCAANGIQMHFGFRFTYIESFESKAHKLRRYTGLNTPDRRFAITIVIEDLADSMQTP